MDLYAEIAVNSNIAKAEKLKQIKNRARKNILKKRNKLIALKELKIKARKDILEKRVKLNVTKKIKKEAKMAILEKRNKMEYIGKPAKIRMDFKHKH